VAEEIGLIKELGDFVLETAIGVLTKVLSIVPILHRIKLLIIDGVNIPHYDFIT
ncbi:hypothetical protein ILR09_00005, partial [Escherichia marmotae]|nr:hypothetical protein [Escherichia marmotae]